MKIRTAFIAIILLSFACIHFCTSCSPACPALTIIEEARIAASTLLQILNR